MGRLDTQFPVVPHPTPIKCWSTQACNDCAIAVDHQSDAGIVQAQMQISMHSAADARAMTTILSLP